MSYFLTFLAVISSAVQHVRRANVAPVFKPRNTTYIVLRFTDEKLDEIFEIPQVLVGEALHQRLDVLLDEHRDSTLIPSIHVTVFDADGRCYEEEVRLDVV